jgi:CPA1 family monovalent cation:H+ antiporter
MTVFQTIAILLTVAAVGSYINNRILRLPTSVGMMLFALLMSWVAMGFAALGWIDLTKASAFVTNIDFSSIFLHGMLSFLLFAGALHIDLHELKKYRVVVALLATIGVLTATFVTGTLVWWTAQKLGFAMPYLYALLFGALISPTDPVAVLGILKDQDIAKSLRLKISSESLLNDGVGVVLFLVLLNLVEHPQTGHLAWGGIVVLLLWEVVGSLSLGLALGWLAYVLLRGIDDYKTEILITLALAAGGYSFAEAVNVSAPIVMVVAGLVIGNHGRAFVMSEKTRKHLDMFWELLDDILNAILFVLMGLEIMIVPMTTELLVIGLVAIVATLTGRWVSVALPIGLMRSRFRFEHGAIRLLTWGGLRGGISIAMALSLPVSPYKNILLGMTYLTVVFSVLFQGTTFSHVVRLVLKHKRHPLPGKKKLI